VPSCSTQEELDRISQEAEDEFKSRSVFQNLEEEQEDFSAWEAKMEQERSEGQFFKQLYVNSDRKRSPSGSVSEEMHSKASEIRSEINRELRSPLRMIIYVFLTTVLVGASMEDAVSEDPSWGTIAIYMAIAVYLALSARREMKLVDESLK